MREVDEEMLQYIWLKRLLKKGTFLSAGGKKIDIIDPGTLNTDSGPDFFNAKIRVDGLLLSGNIEIHLKSSDWLKHKHQHDASYNKLILHVVLVHDVEIEQNKVNGVEVIEVKDFLPDHRNRMKNSFTRQITCHSQLNKIEPELIRKWAEQNQIKRLEQKKEKAKKIAEKNNGDHLQTFYTLLLSNFGFPINKVPFEMLADLLPVRILFIYQQNRFQLEALLLGMAGLLQNTSKSPYLQKLQKEFDFLSEKHQLQAMESHLIKFSRMRPYFFAPYKLAQFAALFQANRNLFSFPQEFDSYEKVILSLNNIELSEHWKKQISFTPGIKCNTGALGINSMEILLINTFSVFQELLQKEEGKDTFPKKSKLMLDTCKFENNYKTRMFGPIKKKGMTARHSQGLIQLYDDLCSRKKCMQCVIGRSIVKEARQSYSKISL